MKGQYKHLLGFTANLIALIVHGTLFGMSWYMFYINWVGDKTVEQFARRGNWAVIGLYLLFVFFFNKILGGYRIGYLRVGDIILSCILATLFSNIVGYFELCLLWRDYVNPIPLLHVTWLEIVFVIMWNLIVRKFYKLMYPPRKMILVYGDYSPKDMISKINGRRDKYNICTVKSYREMSFDDLCAEIEKHQAVLLNDLPGEVRNDIMKYCYEHSLRVYCTPKISDIMFRASEDIHLFDTPLYLFRNQGLTIDQRFVKRMMDIILSLIGIIIASPFMLIIAICIWLYDRGPIFYTQERLTRDGKLFKILKFRSMRVAKPEEGEHITMKDDDRITPIGRVIRKIHFDELPQLFNILIGQMSIVGPRPEWKMTTDEYIKSVPEFAFRLKVKAGLTGYAQVYGKYNTTPYDKVKLDLTYIENYSLWLDFKIMLMTIKILFQKENTEGIDSNQTTALK